MISHTNPSKKPLLKELQTTFEAIIKTLTEEEKASIQDFLKTTEEKIIHWQQQFETGNLSLTEIKWLLYSQKELLTLKTIEVKGKMLLEKNRLQEAVINQLLHFFFKTDEYGKKN